MAGISNRSLLNLALLLLAVGLFAFSLLEPGHHAPVPPARLVPIAPGEVTRVGIERPDHPAVTLERDGKRWWLRAPFEMPADGFRVEALTRAAALTSDTRIPAGEGSGAGNADAARFGLSPPRATLVLNRYRLAFGDTEPVSGRRYVLTDEGIYLTDDRFLPQLLTPPASFVYPGPLGPAATPVEIDLPGETLQFVNGKWALTPERPEVGADALATLVDAWRVARALSVRTYTGDPAAPTPVRVRLLGRGKALRFTLTRNDTEVVLGRPGLRLEYHFPRAAGERLLSLPGANEAKEKRETSKNN